VWTFDTANCTAASTGEAYWQWTNADVIGLQETREAAEHEVIGMENRAAADGWRLTGSGTASAKGTDRLHSSGGVAVGARARFGLSFPAMRPNAELFQGRFTATWLGGVCKGGIYVMTAYLWSGEGMSQRNADLLDAIAGYIQQLRGCWILMADFNLTPEELTESGWPGLVRGRIFAYDGPEGTVKPSRDTIDFFVVCEALAGAVIGVMPVEGSPVKTHTPQRLSVRGDDRGRTKRVLSAPQALPSRLGAGPTRMDIGRGAEACPREATEVELNRAAGAWVSAAEEELVTLVADVDDRAREKMLGRAEGVKFVVKAALGPPTIKFPKLPPGAAKCTVIVNWARDLGWAASRLHVVEVEALGNKRLAQLRRLIADPDVPDELRCYLLSPTLHTAATAAALVGVATKVQDKLVRAHGYKAQMSWFDWAKAGERGGGGEPTVGRAPRRGGCRVKFAPVWKAKKTPRSGRAMCRRKWKCTPRSGLMSGAWMQNSISRSGRKTCRRCLFSSLTRSELEH